MGNCIPLMCSTAQVLKIFCLTRQVAIPSTIQAENTRFTDALPRKTPMLEVCPMKIKFEIGDGKCPPGVKYE